MSGLKFTTVALLLGLCAAAPVAQADEEGMRPTRQSWSFAGPFGTFDKAQLQRGYKVYHDVCSTCHSMNLLAFRNLTDAGGPGFSVSQVKTLAASYKIKDGPNDAGDMFERAGLPSDYFPAPFANSNAAVAALGAAPPDMSLLAKARSYESDFPWFLTNALTQYEEKGPDYIYALLVNGYTETPKDFKLPSGKYYNAIFPSHSISMVNPLDSIFDAQGKPTDPTFYTDGTPMTRAQVARDISAFLMWAAEPKLEERKLTGLMVMLFLIVFTSMLYLVKRKIWANVAH